MLLAGCGTRPAESLFAVAGSLTVDGRPAGNASLAFHPMAPANNRPDCPVAVTADDGSYRLATPARGDGAPAGEYIVTVVWPDPENPFDECGCLDFKKHDRLRGRYADRRTSALRAVVQPRTNRILLQATAARDDETPAGAMNVE